MGNKRTILVVTGGYFPGVNFGGIATSRYNFTEAFGDEYDIVIVTRDHDYKTDKRYDTIQPGYNQYGKARVLYLSDAEFNGEHFGKIMDEVKPDFVYASGTITTIFYFNKEVIAQAHKRALPVLITPDGDVLDNAMRLKKPKKLVAKTLCRLTNAFVGVWFQATSKEERVNLTRHLGIKPKMIFEVSNMPSIFPARMEHSKQKGELNILFFSRIHPKKNLKYAIEVVSKLNAKNVTFDIFGSMEDEPYWNECLELISSAPSNIKIDYKGRLDAAQAKEIAKGYDCFFFPTVSENYGYVIEEALLSGCPVIISRGTTPWDDVHGVAGFTAELGDTDAFVSELERVADMDNEQYGEYCSNIRDYIENKLSYESLREDYRKMFDKITSKN